MAIGAIPLIPLHRVLPSPDARLQRFGLNDSQLFGKPLVTLTVPEARPSQLQRKVPHTVVEPIQSQGTPISQQGLGVDKLQLAVSAAPEGVTRYTGQAGNPSGTGGTGTTPKPGTYLNLKA